MLRRTSLAVSATLIIVALAAVPASTDSLGIGNVPQGTQSDTAYAASNAGVTNTLATTQRTSCYRPEVPTPPVSSPPTATTGPSAAPAPTPAKTPDRAPRTPTQP